MIDASPLAPATIPTIPTTRTPFRTRVLCFESSMSGAGGDLGLEPCCYDVVRCDSLSDALDSAGGSHFDVYVVRGCALDGQSAEFYRWVRATQPWVPIV